MPVYLVHGEDKARHALATRLHEEFGIKARLPALGDAIDPGALRK
jgi:predicted metal-dependent RNase